MSDFEQCLYIYQLYLIFILVKFSYVFGQIWTRYDFLELRQVILINLLYI